MLLACDVAVAVYVMMSRVTVVACVPVSLRKVPSVLRQCWLGVGKIIWPVKN